MNKRFISVLIILVVITSTIVVQAHKVNQLPDKLERDKMYYALMMSLSPSIDKALLEIYKDAPKGVPQWAGWDTTILKIDQLQGVGGSYDVTLQVRPYYGAHNVGDWIDVIKIRVESGRQTIISFKHSDM